jgi:hypothetical protein
MRAVVFVVELAAVAVLFFGLLYCAYLAGRASIEDNLPIKCFQTGGKINVIRVNR